MVKHGLVCTSVRKLGLAFFEYCVQVLANRIGYKAFGAPFSLMELKVIQEVITLLVFLVFTFIFFKSEEIKWNHVEGITCLVGAVYFIFKNKKGGIIRLNMKFYYVYFH